MVTSEGVILLRKIWN